MKKSLSQLVLNPFLHGTSKTQNPGFGQHVLGTRSITIYNMFDYNIFKKILIFFLFFRDNAMNINEFTALIKALFRNEKGRPYQVDNYMITEIFNIFNKQGVSQIKFSILFRKIAVFSLTFVWKKLRSTLNFWLKKLIAALFHSFHSWTKTANKLFSSKFQYRK